jgi:hypothetical protein
MVVNMLQNWKNTMFLFMRACPKTNPPLPRSQANIRIHLHLPVLGLSLKNKSGGVYLSSPFPLTPSFRLGVKHKSP